MIGIIGAMAQEVALIASKIEEKEQRVIAGVEFTKGILSGKEVVLLQSGVGKVNAAMATTLLHEHFHPSAVINIGSAGGLINNMEIGDIIISTAMLHHDVDATPIGCEMGEIPGMPDRYFSNPTLIELAENVLEKLQLRHKIGVIGTGDSFIASEERVAHIQNHFPEVIAVEMEAAAIAQVCFHYKTPSIVMRALSDLPDKESPMTFVEYLQFAADRSANIVMATLEAWPDSPLS